MDFPALPLYDCERTKQLLPNVKDIKVRQQLIMEHIRLAIAIARQPRFSSEVTKNEMISEALFALTVGVNNLVTKVLDDNFDFIRYISLTIAGYLKKARYKNSLFWVDPKTYKKLREKGISVQTIILNNEIEKVWNPTPNEETDLLKNVNLDDREKQIIELRLGNYDDPQIGKLLGISKQRVHKIRSGIGRKVLANAK